MVTRNDRLHALVNGGTGLVVEVNGERRVAFADGAGLRWVEPSQLADVDTGRSMTVHKRQGQGQYRSQYLRRGVPFRVRPPA